MDASCTSMPSSGCCSSTTTLWTSLWIAEISSTVPWTTDSAYMAISAETLEEVTSTWMFCCRRSLDPVPTEGSLNGQPGIYLLPGEEWLLVLLPEETCVGEWDVYDTTGVMIIGRKKKDEKRKKVNAASKYKASHKP